MAKIMALLSMVAAPLLGHYAYEQYKVSECLGGLGKFKTAFEQRSPDGSSARFQDVMVTASRHCEDGEFAKAKQLASAWALRCRVGASC